MKKIFYTLTALCGLFLTLTLTACGGNDPTAVVDDALTALKKGDAEKLMDCIYMDEELKDADSWRELEGELPKAIKRQLKMAESVAPTFRTMLKDVTWKFDNVERKDDEAVVTVKMKRGDEGEISEKVTVVKNKSGDWKLKSMGDVM